MKQKLIFSTKVMAIMLLLLTVVITGCKKDTTAPEEKEEETTTNDPRLLGKWSQTTSTGSNSSLISTYEFKAGQIVDSMLASSGILGVSIISNFRFKWTTTNNNTVSIQSTSSASVIKYVVEDKKLVFTSSDGTKNEFIKVD